jgi:ATP-dependent Clp protease adapter protein ClpS
MFNVHVEGKAIAVFDTADEVIDKFKGQPCEY